MSHDQDRTSGDLSLSPEAAEPQEATVDIDANAPQPQTHDSTIQARSEDTPPSANVEHEATAGAAAGDIDLSWDPDSTQAHQAQDLEENAAPDMTVDSLEASGEQTRHSSAQSHDDRTGAWNDGSDQTGSLEDESDHTGAWGEESDKTGAWPGGKAGAPDRDHDTEALESGAAAVSRPGLSRERAGKKKPGKGELPKQVAGYEILGELGRGGMGVVYKAKQKGLNRLVALKMVLAGAHASAEQLARFKIEGEAVADLQHPNIVQVYEVGEEDGCPFFSLEFIDGDSLTKKIDGTPRPVLEAAELVRKLALAMHVAHQRGIIHRDLKPANILLTKDDVPKITDFGLAKRFEDDKDQGHTRTGAIMGTPSYMAPEQAQGMTKDTGPPADIYSLGSILYDMLTGRPPFRGTTLLETLQQVQSIEPVPPARLQPGVPKDLETICLKSLEKDPQKRYATAGALAEDLRRFVAGEPILARPTPWWERAIKWARRRPAVASLIGVSVAAAVSFLVLGGLWLDSERRAAEDQAAKEEQLRKVAEDNEKREKLLRDRAEKNFQHAQEAVDFMLSQVGQDRLAHVPQMSEIRRDLLIKALDFYKLFQEEKGKDPAIRREAGRSQQRVADIYQKLGQPENALTAYQNAVATFTELAKENPGSVDYRMDWAGGLNNYGNLLEQLKRNDKAEEMYRQAMKLRLELAQAAPKDAALKRDLAETYNNLGLILHALGKNKDAGFAYADGLNLLRPLVNRDGKYKEIYARTLVNQGVMFIALNNGQEAQKSFLKAWTRLAELVKQAPRVPEYRQQLARTWNQLGFLWRDTRPREADDAYQQAIKLRADLVRDFSTVPAYREEWAEAYANLAILLQDTARPKDAGEAHDKALEIRAKAVADFPLLPDLRKKLGSGFYNRASFFLSQARPKEAEEDLNKALDIFTSLHQKHPDVASYQQEVAGTHHNLAIFFNSTGRAQQAETSVLLALKVYQALANRFPATVEHQKELADCFLTVGTIQQINNKLPEAEKSYNRAIELFAGLAGKFPNQPDLLRQLAASYNNRSSLLRALKKQAEAEKSLLASLDLYDKLARDHPEVLDYSLWQARGLGELAILQAQTDRAALSEKTFRLAIELLEKRLARSPVNVALMSQLINLNRNLGSLLKATTRPGEEEKCVLRTLDIAEKLVQSFPAEVSFRQEAAFIQNDVANRLLQREKYAEARKHLQAAADHLLGALKINGKDESARSMLYGTYLNLASALLELGEHRDMAKAVAAATPLAPAKAALHQREAAFLARCMTLASKDKKLSATEAKQLTQSYGNQAMKLLRMAVSKGFRDAAFLEKTADFELLRTRDEFQQLIRKLRSGKDSDQK